MKNVKDYRWYRLTQNLGAISWQRRDALKITRQVPIQNFSTEINEVTEMKTPYKDLGSQRNSVIVYLFWITFYTSQDSLQWNRYNPFVFSRLAEADYLELFMLISLTPCKLIESLWIYFGSLNIILWKRFFICNQ